jgi:hypothetical protein
MTCTTPGTRATRRQLHRRSSSEAKQHKVVIVEVESKAGKGSFRNAVCIDLIAMKGGVDAQKYVDLQVPSTPTGW